jgi:hypothetical protein
MAIFDLARDTERDYFMSADEAEEYGHALRPGWPTVRSPRVYAVSR